MLYRVYITALQYGCKTVKRRMRKRPNRRYWPVRGDEACELLTPNGSSVYGNLTGKLQDDVGAGYLPHTCHQMRLIFQDRDSWDRPVYKGPDGNLYVDVSPRKGWGPNICTKYQNDFDGELDDPVEGVDLIFVPCRDVW